MNDDIGQVDQIQSLWNEVVPTWRHLDNYQAHNSREIFASYVKYIENKYDERELRKGGHFCMEFVDERK